MISYISTCHLKCLKNMEVIYIKKKYYDDAFIIAVVFLQYLAFRCHASLRFCLFQYTKVEIKYLNFHYIQRAKEVYTANCLLLLFYIYIFCKKKGVLFIIVKAVIITNNIKPTAK